jgi:glutathione peroxidase
MTLRQKLLKWVYPLFIQLNKWTGKSRILVNREEKQPLRSFYELSIDLAGGGVLPFSGLKGKKVLLVNTASDCGYTAQYAELQQLYQHSKEDLQIIAVPANDFKDQEKMEDGEIAQFCQKNYGVRFPVARKSVVVASGDQHPVFQWLTRPEQNGWNRHQPDWNFAKYLVDEQGVLTHYFHPSVSPLSTEVVSAVHQ